MLVSKTSVLGLCLGACLASAVNAEELSGSASLPLLDDVPMVLTPARLSQPQSQVPASVTVIDRELIEASGAREIYQLMQLVPGMVALKVDGNVPTVSYHGTQARDVRRMLVLIDGRSQYQPGLSRVLWNDFPIAIEDIERIEVTRGPASPAYGANAFQGVINIITRHPRDVAGHTVAVRQGNNGVNDWRVSSAFQGTDRAVRITATGQRDRGYDGRYYDSRVEVLKDVDMRDAKQVGTINLRSVFELDGNNSLEILAGGSRSKLQRLPEDSDFYTVMDFNDKPDDFTEQAFVQSVWSHQFTTTHELKVQAYAQYTEGNSRFGGCFKLPSTAFPGSVPDPYGALYFTQYMRDVFLATPGNYLDALNVAIPQVLGGAPGAFVPEPDAGPLCADFDIGIREERYDVELQDTFFIDDHTRVVFGANLRKDRGVSETYLDGTRENLSKRLFGNIEIHLAEPLFLNFGGYWERDDINGTNFSPRTALIYEFMPSHSLRLVSSESLRTIDLYEEYADVHLIPQNLNEPYRSDPLRTLGWSSPELFITQQSDGSLVPERIESREIGYFARWGGLSWDIRFYEEELTDLVSGALNPFEFRPNNAGEVSMHGREIQLEWRVSSRHLLRFTGDHRHSVATNSVDPSDAKAESRIANRDGASALWRWDVTDSLMFSTAGYLGHYYNNTRYERADMQLVWNGRLFGSDLRLATLVQRDLTNDPVVFAENVYRDDTRYWITGALTF